VPSREERRVVATLFVDAVNARTVCAHCGAQPVEWHREEHVAKPNARISSLRTQGASLQRIRAEMDLCTPLCRPCHMIEDGRLDALRAAAPYQKGQTYVPPEPCIDCGRPFKPLRRGRCWSCSERVRPGGRRNNHTISERHQ
jgi:hypothetical protein